MPSAGSYARILAISSPVPISGRYLAENKPISKISTSFLSKRGSPMWVAPSQAMLLRQRCLYSGPHPTEKRSPVCNNHFMMLEIQTPEEEVTILDQFFGSITAFVNLDMPKSLSLINLCLIQCLTTVTGYLYSSRILNYRGLERL